MQLPKFALWTRQFEFHPVSELGEGARRLEALGYRTLWLPEALGPEVMVSSALALAATSELVVASGIANIHARTPQACFAAQSTLNSAFPDRFLLGLGVSHAPMVERMHHMAYVKPLQRMAQYLDEMDAATFSGVAAPVPGTRVIAALGPKMLELAGRRAAGAHPYTTTPEHTRQARAILGVGPLLVPEQKVLFEEDPDVARGVARQHLPLKLPNYRNNLERLGFERAEIEALSDRVVDALVAHGSDDAVRARLEEHLEAGADQVAVQVLPHEPTALPMADWGRLASLCHDLLGS